MKHMTVDQQRAFGKMVSAKIRAILDALMDGAEDQECCPSCLARTIAAAIVQLSPRYGVFGTRNGDTDHALRLLQRILAEAWALECAVHPETRPANSRRRPTARGTVQ